MDFEAIGFFIAAIASLIAVVPFSLRWAMNRVDAAQSTAQEEVQKHFKRVESDLAEAEVERRKLAEALHKTNDEVFGIKLKVAAIEGEKKALTEINLRLTKEIEEAKEEIGSLKQQVAQFQKQVNELETQRSNLMNQAAEDRERLMAENLQLTKKIEEMQRTIDALNEQVQVGTVMVAELEGKLQASQEALKAKESSEDTLPIPPAELAALASNSQETSGDPAVNSMGE